ncbi:hypothetical protein U14_01625 [Candidatus Moduliflexus flocculans]|uniref:Uncharacterized protein n=1 Tax=Candidatus Moduliflexus flocculans TaxID=1499966 RepID=A0A0S6VSG6_9BACT|nr:hypothetical protein U14_01625 [Candidatus Moduliflexus flocculans]
MQRTVFAHPKVVITHRVLIACILILSPLVVGFFFDILEQIDIIAIRKLTTREENGTTLLDAVVTIRNKSGKTIKLQQGEFAFAVLDVNGQDIPLGRASLEEIVLNAPASAENLDDSEVSFTMNLGTPDRVQRLYDSLISSAQLNLLEPTSTLSLHFSAHFRLAIQAGQAWNYSNWIDLEWTIAPEVERTTLFGFLQAISQGKFHAPFQNQTTTQQQP